MYNLFQTPHTNLRKNWLKEYHMSKYPHIITGIAVGTILSSKLTLNPINSLLCVSCCVLGSLLPDIDTPNSYIGRRFKLISYPIYKSFGHRTITHSLLLWTLLLIFSPMFHQGLTYGVFCISLYGGVFSHIILDLVSPIGVPVLYPVSHKRVHLIPKISKRKDYPINE